MNKFYVYTDGFYFVKVNTKTLKIRRVRGISRASFWVDEKSAKTWRNTIYAKHPELSLKEAELILS